MNDSATIIPIRPHTDTCSDCGLVDSCLGRCPGRDEHAEARIASEPRVFHRGEHVYYNGDRFENLYMVRSGAVKTYAMSAAGDEQVIAFHMPGDVFGLDGMDTEQHATGAVVLDTSSICVLPFDRICRVANSSPGMQQRLLGRLSARIRNDGSRFVILGQKSADQRIAGFLLTESRRLEARGYSPAQLNLPMPRADIASYLGLAVETVSRVLTRLRDAAVIEVDRSRIQIIDGVALSEMADEFCAEVDPPSCIAH